MNPADVPVALDSLYELSNQELEARILKAKQSLGNQCVILGHHYQREEVYQFADFTGDSLKLARLASQRKEARYIVFCGVHFMAEVADMLSGPNQITLLPDMAAGCSMADMADLPSVEAAWQSLGTVIENPLDQQITPITYVNSTADLKAFCGDHGGIVCTSSNAANILKWAFSQREKALFFPDQHLGRNMGHRLGIDPDAMAVWNPTQPLGGLKASQIQSAKILLWDGFCSVHQMFQPEHIDYYREKNQDLQVIVHPECSFEVCQKADFLGSTEQIQKKVREAPSNTAWAIGTELNLVNRLKKEMPEKEIYFLSPTICMCSTMFRIDLQHLCWTLENLLENHPVNRITVPERETISARRALNRMLSVA